MLVSSRITAGTLPAAALQAVAAPSRSPAQSWLVPLPSLTRDRQSAGGALHCRSAELPPRCPESGSPWEAEPPGCGQSETTARCPWFAVSSGIDQW